MGDLREVRYPEIRVPLVGEDRNAFAVLGKVRAAMRHAGVEHEEIEAFMREATAGDYDDLLATVIRWVVVE